MKPVRFQLEIAFRCDFADIFEVRSGHMVRRGQITTQWAEARQRLRTAYSNPRPCTDLLGLRETQVSWRDRLRG
jgi:hypothetical protein